MDSTTILRSMLSDFSKVMPVGNVPFFKVRITSSGGFTYTGLAAPGTATSDASWLIIRTQDSSGNIDHANSNADFDSAWDNVLSETYG